MKIGSSLFWILAGRPCMGAAGALAGTAGEDKKAIVKLTKILCIVLCFTVLFMVVTTPIVHAEVVALGLSLACTALIIVLLTSMGMKFQSNNAEDLDDWMTGKIIQFPGNGGNNNGPDWLGVVSIAGLLELINGKARVSSEIVNKVSEFGEFLQEDEGIVAGGNPVGQVPISTEIQYKTGTNTTLNGSVTAAWTSSNVLHVVTPSGTWKTGDYNHNFSVGFASSVLTFPVCGTVNWVVSNGYNISNIRIGGGPAVGSLNSYFTIKTSNYYDTNFNGYTAPSYNNYFSIQFNGNSTYSSNTSFGPTEFYITFTGAQAMQPGGTVITPSATIVDLPELGPGQYLEIGGSAFSDAANAEEALTNVVDDVLSPAGYQAPAGDPGGIEVPEGSGWLYETITGTGESIVTGIGGLFVPRPGFWEEYVDSISDVFDDRMGILTYPLHVMTDFVDRISDVQDGDHKMTWPDISLNGVTVIRQGEYDFDDLLNNESLEALYDVYLVIVKAIILGLFISLCWRKLEEIEQS